MDNGETEAEIEFKENRTGGQYKNSIVEFFTVKGKNLSWETGCLQVFCSLSSTFS